jgi:hypothetical protein
VVAVVTNAGGFGALGGSSGRTPEQLDLTPGSAVKVMSPHILIDNNNFDIQ